MSDITGAITGLAQGFNKYLELDTQAGYERGKLDYANKLETKRDAAKQIAETAKTKEIKKFETNLEDVLTPDMAEKAMPGYGAKLVNDYNAARPDNPLKLKEGVNYLKNAVDHLDKKNTAQQKSDDIRLTQYARTLSSDREFSGVRTKRDNIENMSALLDQVETQPEGPDRRQVMETAMAQVRVLINSGQISEKEIEHLMPDTFRGKIAKGLEFFTNKPEGTEAQDFVKRARDFFHRESNVTNDQLSRRMNELSAPYKNILDRNGDVASETFQTYNVNHPRHNPKHNEEKTAPRKGMVAPENDPLGLFK